MSKSKRCEPTLPIKPAPELVRIGVGNARIKRVTPQRVEYLDEVGQECFVDLEDGLTFAHSWRDDGPRVRQLHEGFLDRPQWIQFENRRRTRLEFRSIKEVQASGLAPPSASEPAL